MPDYVQMNDAYFIGRAMELAVKSSRIKGLVPPYVGAVIVKNGRIVGEGHKKFLTSDREFFLHAERDAINDAHGNLQGAILYTVLQPCLFGYGNVFPPSSKLIIESGIEKVVIGLHPRRGLNSAAIRLMRENGIEVVLFDGGLQSELRRLIYGRNLRYLQLRPSPMYQ